MEASKFQTAPAQLFACALLTWLSVAAGDAAAQTPPPPADPIALDRLQVEGKVSYLHRAERPVTLVFDREYFERFGPQTVGDMLQRVPSVTFLSDILEYDGVRLRGLDAGYTQILINGERVPGAGSDRAFFVDRIPAELVERIEIDRSSSADRSGDAIAGSLNIVLRDGYAVDGGYLRIAGVSHVDGVIEPSIGSAWSGAALGGNLLLGADVQGRRNPKRKNSQRFDGRGGEQILSEQQTDLRTDDDRAFNMDYERELGDSSLGVSAYVLRSDTLKDERSVEYASGVETDDNIANISRSSEDIDSLQWGLDGDVTLPMLDGETQLELGYAVSDNALLHREDRFDYLRDAIAFPEDDLYRDERSTIAIDDREWSASFSHQRLASGMSLSVGIDAIRKQRDTVALENSSRIVIPDAPEPRPEIPGPLRPLDPRAGGISALREDRLEPFLKLEGRRGAIHWETGVRYQFMQRRLIDLTLDPLSRRQHRQDAEFLPSLHLRYDLDAERRLSLSLARTLRWPGFDQLSPVLIIGELGENDLLGNPALAPETAWGIDFGIDQRLSSNGILGVNLFYRDISDVIEIASTGIEGDAGPGSLILTPRNTGDGKVWGVELDLSTRLALLGLENTSIFLNTSWLDSKIYDLFGRRRFNDQPRVVLNAGFNQELPTMAAAIGLSYSGQGGAFGRIVAEEIRTSYQGNLQSYVEKRFGTRWTVRFTGSNLLDAAKTEITDEFETIAAQLERDVDRHERESETSGRVYQLMLRYTF